MMEREVPTREWKNYKIDATDFVSESDTNGSKEKSAGHFEHVEAPSV